MAQEKVAFIGAGVMGLSMAGNLMKAGYPVSLYTRTKSKAEPLLAQGAGWGDTPAEVVEGADFVVTIVGYPKDVEEVYLGEKGILSAAKPGAVAMDMTTSSPILARKLAEAGASNGITILDAPVSGGDSGAREARLSIMVGGEQDAYQRALPLFNAMGANVVYQGPAGSGQHTKMCNQIAIASGMVAIGEALSYAKKAGLKPETVLKSISAGAAGSWSMSNLVPRALAGDYDPGFFIKHFVKDMSIALESADEMGLDLPGLAYARKLYQDLIDKGCGDEGTQALIREYLAVD